MSYAQNLRINYEFQPDITPEALAQIQQMAVEQHAGLEKGADKQREIELKSEEIANILYSSSGYSLIVAMATSDETPEQDPLPVGYILTTRHENRDEVEVIDDFYVVRQFKLNNKTCFSKGLAIGEGLHAEMIDSLPEMVEEIHALPLEGSEKSYANRGYRGKSNTTWIKQLKN